MRRIVENVVYQHVENVCSLWLQREQAVEEPHYDFSDLVHLDNRLDANLDGLRVAGAAAGPMLEEMRAAGDEGALFGLAVLVLERGKPDAFAGLVAGTSDDGARLAELGSALAWVDPRHLGNTVKALLDGTSAAEIVLGLDACAAHGRSPGTRLGTLLQHPDASVRAAACRTAADLGERDFAAMLEDATAGSGDDERFHRARALALLGRGERARPVLESLGSRASPRRSAAIALLMAMSDSRSGRSFLKGLGARPGRERDVVAGCGLLGDPIAMEWLIRCCEDPALARLAGGAMTMISGIDLAYEDLELDDAPEAGPNDDPSDDNVALDEDENLPWPDPERVRAWWLGAKHALPAGTLFLDGRAKTRPELERTLALGMQRQRNAAALALALASPDACYRNTRLPAVRQRAWMAAS